MRGFGTEGVNNPKILQTLFVYGPLERCTCFGLAHLNLRQHIWVGAPHILKRGFQSSQLYSMHLYTEIRTRQDPKTRKNFAGPPPPRPWPRLRPRGGPTVNPGPIILYPIPIGLPLFLSPFCTLSVFPVSGKPPLQNRSRQFQLRFYWKRKRRRERTTELSSFRPLLLVTDQRFPRGQKSKRCPTEHA